MGVIQTLFTTWAGLLSLFSIAFMIGMGVVIYYTVKNAGNQNS